MECCTIRKLARILMVAVLIPFGLQQLIQRGVSYTQLEHHQTLQLVCLLVVFLRGLLLLDQLLQQEQSQPKISLTLSY